MPASMLARLFLSFSHEVLLPQVIITSSLFQQAQNLAFDGMGHRRALHGASHLGGRV